MIRRQSFIFATILAILLPMAIFAAQPEAKAAATSVTGCLQKGPDADHFMLKDAKGKEYTVTGDSATLAKHANNHNVTITGTMTKEKGKSVLKMDSASDLKMNSMCK